MSGQPGQKRPGGGVRSHRRLPNRMAGEAAAAGWFAKGQTVARMAPSAASRYRRGVPYADAEAMNRHLEKIGRQVTQGSAQGSDAK